VGLLAEIDTLFKAEAIPFTSEAGPAGPVLGGVGPDGAVATCSLEDATTDGVAAVLDDSVTLPLSVKAVTTAGEVRMPGTC